MNPVQKFETLLKELYVLSIQLQRLQKEEIALKDSLREVEHTPTKVEVRKLKAAMAKGNVGPADVQFFEIPTGMQINFDPRAELATLSKNFSLGIAQWNHIKAELLATRRGFLASARRGTIEPKRLTRICRLADQCSWVAVPSFCDIWALREEVKDVHNSLRAAGTDTDFVPDGKHEAILQYLCEQGAIDMAKKRTVLDIAAGMRPRTHAPDSLKHPLADLTRYGMLTSGGRSGGYWITPEGIRYVESIE